MYHENNKFVLRIKLVKYLLDFFQRQLVSSNATFNAYLLAQKPDVQKAPKYVNLVREIVLEDDMKEYWGFYLLQGSTVTVSSCCR